MAPALRSVDTTSGVATPDAGQTAQLLAALAAVDPGLATNPTDAVSNAVSLCLALGDGDDPAGAVGSTFPDVDLDATGQQAVVTAVTGTFCPAGGTTSAGAGSASPSAS